MLSEGMRNGCKTKVSRNSATMTVRSSDATASGTVGRCSRICLSRVGAKQLADLALDLDRGTHCAACSSCSTERSSSARWRLSIVSPCRVAVRSRAGQARQRATRGILLGVLLGAAHAAGQRLAGLAFGGAQAHLDQESLAMVGAAFAFHAIHRGARAHGLQMFLERRFVVAQGRAGEQLAGQLLHRVGHHVAAHEGAHRIQPAVEKQRADDGFHGVGQHGALAAQAAAVLAPAEAQVAAQVERSGDFGHVMAADQLGAHPGQLAFAPLGMEEEHGFGHHQAQHGVAQEFQAFVVGWRPRGSFSAPSSIRSLARERWVSARTSRSGLAKPYPECRFEFAQTCCHSILKIVSSILRTGQCPAPSLSSELSS